ncbi:MAG: VWA domain-containing protein [Candidatus Gallimonas sp.]
MSSINFDNAYLLLLAIPLVLLLAVPFFLAVKKDNANGHNIASLSLHVLMAVMVAFTAAGAKIETVITETNVYVLADVSYSANRNLDQIDGYISRLNKELPKNTRMGVVCFGKDYKLLTRLGETPKSVKEARVDDSGTDVVSALGYTGDLFRDGVVKRIVLITDGKQSDGSDGNAIKRAVDALNAEGVHVDAIYVDDNLGPDAKDVQISGVEFTQTAYLNHETTATATIRSSYDCNAIVSLYRDGEKRKDLSVTLSKGASAVSFQLPTDLTGAFDYEIRVAAPDDGNPYDNAYSFTQSVTGRVNVLLITSNSADVLAAQSLYGDRATIDAYVNDPETPCDVPCSVEALCRYDEILISDVDLTDLKNNALFVKSLNTVVSAFGKSLITFGNLNLQNRTDELTDEFSKMLPVKFGNSELDPKLYTIIIDSSDSMFSLGKLERAKCAATKLLDLVSDSDDVCVVKFDGAVTVVQQPTSAKYRKEIQEKILSIETAHGTVMSGGFNKAKEQIEQLDAIYGDKQIMLVSDGLNYANDADPIGIVGELNLMGVATSVLDVGRGADTSPAAQNAKTLLEAISTAGGGMYRLANTVEEAEEIVFGEMGDSSRETVVTGSSAVSIKKSYDEVVSGIDAAPYIDGYVNGKAKARATTVLTTNYYPNDSGVSVAVPLYSYWSYGNGKVSAFSSSFTGDWIGEWRDSGFDALFFRKVLEVNTPTEKIDVPFTVSTRTENGYCAVEITPATVRYDATVTVAVTAPDGERTERAVALDVAAYSYTFVTPQTGKYLVRVSYSYGGAEYVSERAVNLSYLPEYDSFTVFDAAGLYKAVGGTGTVSEDGTLSLVNDESEVGVRTVRLTVPLLIACVGLFAADVVVRKLKWSDIRSLFGLVDKEGKK